MASLEQLQDNWPILGGFVAGVVAWGKTITTVKSLGDGHVKLDARVAKVEQDISALRESTGRIASTCESTQSMIQTLLEDRLGK